MSTPTDGGAPDDRAQLDREIERTRQELGDTVEELAAKLDVKTRTKEKVADGTEAVKATGQRVAASATDTYRQRPAVVYAGAAAVVLAAVLLVARRRAA